MCYNCPRMRTRVKSIAAIAAAYTGTLFGAGFVSGQEILRFFAAWGGIGVVGALLAGAGFALVGIVIMLLARRDETSDFERIISPVRGLLPKAIGMLISIWLFGVNTVMLAAAGNLFHSLTGLPSTIGAAALTVALILMHMFGAEGFSRALSFAVPVMVLAGFGTAAAGVFHGHDAALSAAAAPDFTVAPHWLFSAALYISYNILAIVGVLAPLGRKAALARDTKIAAVIGGGVPGLFAALLCAAMLRNRATAFSNDMPMFAIAHGMSPVLGWVYALALFIGIFTAAAGLSFSLISRLEAYPLPGVLKKRTVLAGALCLLAFAGSSLGFASLVGTVYPAFGWLGLLVIALMCVNFFRPGKAKKAETGAEAQSESGENLAS